MTSTTHRFDRPASRPTSARPDLAHLNLAVVHGRLSSDPVERTLPSGDTIRTYEITVRRADQPTETVPVVQVGGRPPGRLAAGDPVVVVGRVRRRFFRAGGGTASRTEVVAEALVPARRAAAVRTALGRAAAQLAAAGPPG